MAFQFELRVYTLSKIRTLRLLCHRSSFTAENKNSFQKGPTWGIQCLIELSDGTKLPLALDCLHIQAADGNTLLHCEGVVMDATLSEAALQLWPGRGGAGGRGLCTGRGDAIGDVSHTLTHTRKHADKQTNKHASSPETAVVLDYRIRN